MSALREVLGDIGAEAHALRDEIDDIDGTKFGDLERLFNKMAGRCDRMVIAIRAAMDVGVEE